MTLVLDRDLADVGRACEGRWGPIACQLIADHLPARLHRAEVTIHGVVETFECGRDMDQGPCMHGDELDGFIYETALLDPAFASSFLNARAVTLLRRLLLVVDNEVFKRTPMRDTMIIAEIRAFLKEYTGS